MGEGNDVEQTMKMEVGGTRGKGNTMNEVDGQRHARLRTSAVSILQSP